MEGQNITVRQCLDTMATKRSIATVAPDATLKEVVKAMVKGLRRRVVYVVDNEMKLQGHITLKNLKDIVFSHFLSKKLEDALVLSEENLELFASDTAAQLMESDVPVCHEDDQLHRVLEWMMEADLLDIAVLDKHDRLVADLDVLDLLEQWLLLGREVF